MPELSYFALVIVSVAGLLRIWSVRDQHRRQNENNEHFRRHCIWLERKGGIE